MLRIALCLLLLLISSTVAAREVKMSSPDGGGCPDDVISPHSDELAPAMHRSTPARSETIKIKPGIQTETPANRSPSIRLHSFVPGMFR